MIVFVDLINLIKFILNTGKIQLNVLDSLRFLSVIFGFRLKNHSLENVGGELILSTK